MANAATHGRVTRGRGRSAPLLMVIRVVIALGLAVDAYVHFILAPQYQQAYPDGMGGGTLFRIQAVAAILAGLYVLIRGSRLSYAIAALVALSAFAAVVLSVYIQLPQVGPIPAMYEPLWFFGCRGHSGSSRRRRLLPGSAEGHCTALACERCPRNRSTSERLPLAHTAPHSCTARQRGPSSRSSCSLPLSSAPMWRRRRSSSRSPASDRWSPTYLRR